ncbi:hypothetical protein CEXT_406711 [Caerostris extrusa]|uniref:Uncharacterized protein n=1 Tax=Caerostris extrusa TaxID=172846 RepID=A0AAV4XY93_CAEEX|nr:hypothetical protein CEXT_406711 [Caerostris extrusa]
MALLHSQDIQDGLDSILKWLDDAESNLRNQSRPVSLIKEKLEEQIQAHKVMLSDIDGQKPTLMLSAKALSSFSSGANRFEEWFGAMFELTRKRTPIPETPALAKISSTKRSQT